jgi:serine/threonine-protein kinase
MAPEQLANLRDLDARTDIWGLGVVLYQMLTGRLPFPARSLLELTEQLRNETPCLACRLREDVPESLSRVLARCLEKRREDRWPSVAELLAQLRPFTSPAGASSLESGDSACARAFDPPDIALGETLEGTSDLRFEAGSSADPLRSLPALALPSEQVPRWLPRGVEWAFSLALLSGLSYSVWSHVRGSSLAAGAAGAALETSSRSQTSPLPSPGEPAPIVEPPPLNGAPQFSPPNNSTRVPPARPAPPVERKRPRRATAPEPSKTAEPEAPLEALPIDRQLDW